MLLWPGLGAAAQPASTDSGALEEVVVTAQFRTENLQNTALAITAVSGDQLQQQSITNVADLGNVIPNASIRPQSSGSGPTPQIGMRGVQTSEFIYTTDPGVGVYIDDVYQGALNGAAIDLLDLDRVEVLRGPQGTLFGKNSLGGAIRLISKVPQGNDTGSLELTYGTYNKLDFKGTYDFAMTDKLFVRISGVSKRIDGYQDVLDFTCQMKKNGTPQLAGTFPSLVPSNLEAQGDCKIGERGGSQTQAARLMLRYLATDDLEFNVSADYSHMNAESQPDSFLTSRQKSDFFDNLYQNTVIFPKYGITYNNDNRFVPKSPFQTYGADYDPINGHSFPPGQKAISKNADAKAAYKISDDVRLDVIAAYRSNEADWFTNGTGMPIELANQYNLTTHSQHSLEARLSGALFDKRLEWTTGAYQYDDHSHLGGFVALPALAAILPSFSQNDSFTTQSTSGFVHGAYKVTDQWSVTAGGRYTDEKKTYHFDHSPYLAVPGNLNYGSNHFDWKLSTDYRFNPQVMVYASASTGFRSDGAQPRPFTPGQQRVPTQAEKLTSYEIGAKTDLLERRLRVNMAVFVDNYSPRVFNQLVTQCNLPSDLNAGLPYQAISPSNPCPAGTPLAGTTGVPWFFYSSAPGRDSGLEFEVTANPIDNLSVNGTLALYDFSSKAPKTANGGPNPAYVDPSFKIQAPISGSLGAQYRIQAFAGSLTPRLDWFYQGYRSTGEQYLPQLSGSDNKVPGYGLVNARLSYTPEKGNWTVALAAENLFDRFYWYQLSAARDTVTGAVNESQIGAPARGRVVEVTFRHDFK